MVKKIGIFTTQTQPIFEVMDVSFSGTNKNAHKNTIPTDTPSLFVAFASGILRRFKDRLGGLAGAKDLAIQHQVDLPRLRMERIFPPHPTCHEQ